MLYHFAITPEVFEPSAILPGSREAVILFELLKGIADNGLLANLNAGAWQKRVREHEAENGSAEIRDKLRTCMKQIDIRNRLIRHPAGSSRQETDDFRWLHWALERHRADPDYPFKGVFTTQDFLELSELADPALVPLLDALDHICWINRVKSIEFVKCEIQLRKQLRPLLRHAEKVTLIDPYLSCRKQRFLDTVQHCADLLGKHDGRQQRGVIHIHAGNPMYEEDDQRENARDRLDRWELELAPVVKHWGHRFEVFLWKNIPGGKTFHDRYIITDQCGISAPGGLDFENDPARANITTWAWLESSIIENILQRQFHPKKGPYQLLNSRKIG